MNSKILESWKGMEATLATMHGKEAIIAPLFKESLQVNVSVPELFDTDRFGTFTRDIKRAGTQLETAREKALAAMKQTGTPLGIASEGSFGTHPAMPFVSVNIELVVLIDSINQLEIVGQHLSHTVQTRSKTISSPEEALSTALSWGFPEQGVILRQSEHSNRHIYKNITSEAELLKNSRLLLSRFFATSCFMETDMRAHRCPKRRESIKEATLSLIANCQSLCPMCSTPGFSVVRHIPGLPCTECGQASQLIKASVWSCQKCHYTKEETRQDLQFAEAKDCQWCNP
jgi:hypothetical protein